MRYSGQIVFAVFPRRFCLSLLDRLLKWTEDGRLVSALQRPITLHDAFRRVGMRPQRNPVSAEEGVPHRMIEVIVRVQGALHGTLANHPQSIHLEGSSGHATK